MNQHAVTPDGRVLLDGEAIERTLSRVAHEIIERNDDLEMVALVGIHTRGVPLSQRLRRLVAERCHRELPIRPDFVGKNLPTARSQRVQVQLLEIDEVDRVVLIGEPEEGEP